jgi:hypothetical protein
LALKEWIVGSLSKSLLLFTLNWLDAQLTILWVRLNVATEGNGLMAHFLNHSESSFLLVKLLIGTLAALILYRCAHLPLARRGMRLVLAIYITLMILHVVTGYSALGWQAPAIVVSYFGSLPKALVSMVS